MGKAFYVDYIRQIIEQTLENEHIKNPNLVGGKNQLNLFSFYEQLVEHEEVDRYVENFNQLADQQNRMGLIANGILSAPENPTITNLNNCIIIPLSFTCAFRITLENRDLILDTINNLITIHKGRKVDIAEMDNGKLFMVGTIANNVSGVPLIKVGDFIGTKTNSSQTISAFISERFTYYSGRNITTWETFGDRTQYLYFEDTDGKLKVVAYIDNAWKVVNNDNTYDDIIFPPTHNSFTKYKVSLSFDALRCETPKSLNGKEIILISFGGSATIVNRTIRLGNDLTKVGIMKYKRVEASGDVFIDTSNTYWLEPLEMPSSNSADTQLNKLMSNKFIANSQTDSLSLSLQYTFMVDNNNTLINQWFRYARYGVQTSITPNIIYKIFEYFVSWGTIYYETFYAKIVESIDIENTESDTLTITIPFQIQGDNN